MTPHAEFISLKLPAAYLFFWCTRRCCVDSVATNTFSDVAGERTTNNRLWPPAV
jgi:hypothetical protein